MPIYEYKCEGCEDTFEKILGISAPLPPECPLCGLKGKIKKLVSAPSFRLKGSGWYETDFKTGNKKNLSKDDKEKKPSNEDGTKKAVTKDKINSNQKENK